MYPSVLFRLLLLPTSSISESLVKTSLVIESISASAYHFSVTESVLLRRARQMIN